MSEWVEPVPDAAGTFRTDGVGRDRDVDLMPFYRLHRRLYSAYWDLFTPSQWAEREAANRRRARTGPQARRSHRGFLPTRPNAGRARRQFRKRGGLCQFAKRAEQGRVGRDWFSFELPVDSQQPMVLVVTYYSGRRPREPKFDILVDGEPIAKEETVKRDSPGTVL